MDSFAVTVVGAGGIGSAVGHALLATGAGVTFVETDSSKLEAGRRSGLKFVKFDDWKPTVESPILLCVKCYDNAAALERIPPGAMVVPIQNGFDSRLDSFGHAAEGIASFVAASRPESVEPTIARPGELHIGPRGDKPIPKAVMAMFENLDCPGTRQWFVPKLVAKILPIKHTKLMYNAAISPLAAAAGIDNGELLGDPHARKLFFALIQENYSILAAAGIELGKVGPFHPRTVAKILRRKWLARVMAKFFEPSLRGTYCSMAGEIEKGRTEIENYNGHLLRMAEGRVEAPLNRTVFDLVKRMEMVRAKPDRGILQSLAKNV